MSKQETPQLFLHAFDLKRGGGRLKKRGLNTAPLATQLQNKATLWGGGWGSFGIQPDGDVDLVVKKSDVWFRGGLIQELKGNKEETHSSSKALMMTCSRVRLQ